MINRVRRIVVFLSACIIWMKVIPIPISAVFADSLNKQKEIENRQENFSFTSNYSLLENINNEKKSVSDVVEIHREENQFNSKAIQNVVAEVKTELETIERSESIISPEMNSDEEEQRFSFIGEDIRYVDLNSETTIAIHIVNETNSFRLSLPQGVELKDPTLFKSVELIDTDSNGTKSLILTTYKVVNEIQVGLLFKEQGKKQITVEDPLGEVSADFLFVMVDTSTARQEQDEKMIRSSVNVTTSAQLVTAWNNTSCTQIIGAPTANRTVTAAQVNSMKELNRILTITRSTTFYFQPVTNSTNRSLLVGTHGRLILDGVGSSLAAPNSTMSIQGFNIIDGHLEIINGAYFSGTTGSKPSISVESLSVSSGGSVEVETLNTKELYVTSHYTGTDRRNGEFLIQVNTPMPLNFEIMEIETPILYIGGSPMGKVWENLKAKVIKNEVISSNHAGFTTENFQSILTYTQISDIRANAGSIAPEPETNNKFYKINVTAEPTVAGNPTSTSTELEEGQIATLQANPNTGYRFVKWEIIEGAGSEIASLTSPNTSLTMGSSDTKIRAIYEEEKESYELTLEASPEEGGTPRASVTVANQGESIQLEANPANNYTFLHWEIVSGEGGGISSPQNEHTEFVMGTSNTTIRAVYELTPSVVDPVDPLDPEIEVDPENKPEIPEDQGLLSIDFASRFAFGTQAIAVKDRTYYAQPQRLLKEDHTINEKEIRPNYVQISDRRPKNNRYGWQLAVTQKEQFKGPENRELLGAQLEIKNQKLVTVQGGQEPSLQNSDSVELIPGNKQTLLRAEADKGTGTWIYRFGDVETAEESVTLNVPKGSNPEATNYSTTFIWELNMIPEN